MQKNNTTLFLFCPAVFYYNEIMQLIEAVPNVSEGTRESVLQAAAQAIQNVSGVRLLHVDPNADANRTVFTFAGEPQAVCRACLALYKTMITHADMRTHHGAHPRLGLVDVCPLVPVQGITLLQTAAYARDLAQEVAVQFNIPVYLYEANAATPERKNLAFLRQGEYESLPVKLPKLLPDFGPCTYSKSVARTGASVIGARNFLIAFNMSLNTKDVTPAKAIAAVLREKNGGLQAVKAIGWYMENYRCAQVSCNLTNFHITGLAQVFEACQKEASKWNLKVTGSEIIGLVPKEALQQAGKFYAPHLAAEAQLYAATEALLLHKIRPFDLNERILEKLLHCI